MADSIGPDMDAILDDALDELEEEDGGSAASQGGNAGIHHRERTDQGRPGAGPLPLSHPGHKHRVPFGPDRPPPAAPPASGRCDRERKSHPPLHAPDAGRLPAAPLDASAGGALGGDDDDDDERLLRGLFEGLVAAAGGEAPGEGGLPGGPGASAGTDKGGEGGFSPDDLVDGLLKELLSRDLMYEPMKEVADRFPSWLERHKDDKDLPFGEWDRRNQQYECFRNLVGAYEEQAGNDSDAKNDHNNNDESDNTRILELLQQIQEHGPPPAEILRAIAPGLEPDGDGFPDIAGGFPPFPGGSGIPGEDDCRVM
ncbi:unnamed protein product [Pseudo-nitzschia multistriata]|uniref:Peroxisomal biogenesis factor 19 n=1 Tax=Pseudo-nitzschia multistriata TaxID=183589 RepID=A0A448ZH77_9STRA|nr:unnamed protein product [Pseudo-nitzschia multistriata]